MLMREEIINIVKKVLNKSKSQSYKKAIHLNYLSSLNISNRLRVARMLKFTENFLDYNSYWNSHLSKYKNFKRWKNLLNKSKQKSDYKELLRNKYYIITFKAFASNFFIMLTDCFGNPLISCSTGQVSKSRSKKKKNSLMLIYPMMKKIKAILIKHRVKNLAIHIRTDISPKIITAIKFINYSRIKFKIIYIASLKPMPHHFGRKQKKPRRV